MEKRFKLQAEQIKRLIPERGGCIASDMITVGGLEVGYMYREPATNEMDSGWRFFSGTESQEYVDDPSNTGIYDLNTIANYDEAIIKYLSMEPGTELERLEGTADFVIIGDEEH